jgi:hypothetical protein
MESFYFTSLNYSLITLVPPLLLLILLRQPPAFRWLTFYLLFWLLAEIGGKTLYYFKINPNFSAHTYYILSTLLITAFFYFANQWQSKKKLLVLINVAYILFGLWNLIEGQKNGPNSYTISAQAILILIFSICFFYKMLKELPTLQVQKDPLFIIISALFFSFAGKFILYLVMHYFINELKDNLLLLWTIHNWLTIIANLIITVGCYLQYKSLKEMSLQKSKF